MVRAGAQPLRGRRHGVVRLQTNATHFARCVLDAGWQFRHGKVGCLGGGASSVSERRGKSQRHDIFCVVFGSVYVCVCVCVCLLLVGWGLRCLLAPPLERLQVHSRRVPWQESVGRSGTVPYIDWYLAVVAVCVVAASQLVCRTVI